MKNGAKFLWTGEKANDNWMLGPGVGFFAQSGYGSKGEYTEAFFFDAKSAYVWSVLDGVERLPDLDPDVSGKSHIEDIQRVRFVRGFGGPEYRPMLLCIIDQQQGDMRSSIPRDEEMCIAWKQWHHSILVASDGSRYETGILQDHLFTNKAWLHNSEKLAVCSQFGEDGQARKLKIYDFGTSKQR